MLLSMSKYGLIPDMNRSELVTGHCSSSCIISLMVYDGSCKTSSEAHFLGYKLIDVRQLGVRASLTNFGKSLISDTSEGKLSISLRL